MRAEAGESEGLAVHVPDREHDARAEMSVGAPPERPGRKPSGHQLLGRVTKSAEVIHQLVRTDRRVSNGEGAKHLLVEVLLCEGVAGGPTGLRLPEIGLKELGGVR